MKSHFVLIPLLLSLSACPAKEEKEDKKKSSKSDKEETTATATATATAVAATATATAEVPDAADSAIDLGAAEVDEKAFASVEVPASVSVPTEEDYEAGVEKEITPANADTELKKLEVLLDAGTP